MKYYYVYILASKSGVLYIGVTNNLERRVVAHKNKTAGKFTSRYNVSRLMYYEVYNDINLAIAREKQLKAGTRQKKVELVEKENPGWRDISEDWF